MLRCEAHHLLYPDVGAACASGLSAGGLAPLVLCHELLARLTQDTASLCMKYSSDALHVGKNKGQTAKPSCK